MVLLSLNAHGQKSPRSSADHRALTVSPQQGVVSQNRERDWFSARDLADMI
jgi:hypothetical protein